MHDLIASLTPDQFEIQTLGPAKIKSPVRNLCDTSAEACGYKSSRDRVLLDPYWNPDGNYSSPLTLEKAGPREHIYYDPTKLKAAIVTCGGMCPGINSLVRSITLQLYYIYGVSNIVGIRYGLQGFIPEYGRDFVELNPDTVSNVHGRGGSFLGMSRGPQSMEDIVDTLERNNIGLLFMIGGDGTMRAAQKIYKEITNRKLKIGVICIPKTIDNDIAFVERTFGFGTAVEAATRSILGAHNEAEGAPNGVGLVKLMGRHSGFVAANATLALTEVNFCLLPEVDFDIDGERGLLAQLEERLELRGHAVIVVAEGAGQKFFDNELGTDASGNKKLSDIGTYLKQRIVDHYRKMDKELVLKYIDPSYMIRSVPSNSDDRIFCGFLGHHAVHAGMSGRTGMVVSLWNNQFVHVPIDLVIRKRKKLDPTGGLWRAVCEATGQRNLCN